MTQTMNDIKVGDRVVWFSPRIEGTIADVDYSSVQIQWDDGKSSIITKCHGFIGWKVLTDESVQTEEA